MWRRIIWQPSGGYWLFYWSAIYLAVGMYSIFIEKIAPFELIQVVWLCIIALPLVCNPLARRLNMKENHMIKDLFYKKPVSNNIVPFPEPKGVPNVPYVEPPEPKKDPKTYYTFGVTDDNRVSFTMGYTTLTMTATGVQNLIDQLEFFKSQLSEEHDE